MNTYLSIKFSIKPSQEPRLFVAAFLSAKTKEIVSLSGENKAKKTFFEKTCKFNHNYLCIFKKLYNFEHYYLRNQK